MDINLCISFRTHPAHYSLADAKYSLLAATNPFELWGQTTFFSDSRLLSIRWTQSWYAPGFLAAQAASHWCVEHDAAPCKSRKQQMDWEREASGAGAVSAARPYTVMLWPRLERPLRRTRHNVSQTVEAVASTAASLCDGHHTVTRSAPGAATRETNSP